MTEHLPRILVRKVTGTAIVLCVFLLAASACFAQVLSPRSVPLPDPIRQIPVQPLSASVSGGFSVAAVGDLIIAHPHSASRNPGFLDVEKLLRGADVTFGNLEESLILPRELRVWPASENGGDALYGPPLIATDLKDMGFDLLSHANNHDTDWGIRGMEVTDRVLNKAGLVHAGTGLDLAAARAPRYLTTPQGRIALIAMTSSYTPMEPAGAPARGVAGRPGVNVLHTTLYHDVTTQQMGWLRNIFDTQPHKPAHPANPHADQLELFGIHYRVGSVSSPGVASGLTYTMNPGDLDGILRSIREGKEESNFELVYVHAHNPGNWSEWPANFLPTLAHDAINAGADEFVASGPHRLRGIEIYKGKPIFYSLGNFFFELGQLRYFDPDIVEKAHLDFGAITDYEFEHYRLSHNSFTFNSPIWYQSVVAVSVFNREGDVIEVKLYPIDLGYKRIPMVESGVPYLASPKIAQQILRRLQRLSQPYGTRIEIRDDVGIIHVAKNG